MMRLTYESANGGEFFFLRGRNLTLVGEKKRIRASCRVGTLGTCLYPYLYLYPTTHKVPTQAYLERIKYSLV